MTPPLNLHTHTAKNDPDPNVNSMRVRDPFNKNLTTHKTLIVLLINQMALNKFPHLPVPLVPRGEAG